MIKRLKQTICFILTLYGLKYIKILEILHTYYLILYFNLYYVILNKLKIISEIINIYFVEF